MKKLTSIIDAVKNLPGYADSDFLKTAAGNLEAHARMTSANAESVVDFGPPLKKWAKKDLDAWDSASLPPVLLPYAIRLPNFFAAAPHGDTNAWNEYSEFMGLDFAGPAGKATAWKIDDVGNIAASEQAYRRLWGQWDMPAVSLMSLVRLFKFRPDPYFWLDYETGSHPGDRERVAFHNNNEMLMRLDILNASVGLATEEGRARAFVASVWVPMLKVSHIDGKNGCRWHYRNVVEGPYSSNEKDCWSRALGRRFMEICAAYEAKKAGMPASYVLTDIIPFQKGKPKVGRRNQFPPDILNLGTDANPVLAKRRGV